MFWNHDFGKNPKPFGQDGRDPYDDLVEHLQRSLCELCRRGPWRGELMFVPVKDAPPGDDWPEVIEINICSECCERQCSAAETGEWVVEGLEDSKDWDRKKGEMT